MRLIIRDDVTERLHALALLLDSISSLVESGLISHEKGFEECNCCLTQVDELLKIDTLEEGDMINE
jgi:hypothetical protein